jgi:hypothetical protein
MQHLGVGNLKHLKSSSRGHLSLSECKFDVCDAVLWGWVTAVSKAFSCLSNPDQRAGYDRFGEEGPPTRMRANGPPPGFAEFDADQVFNMFFNGGLRPG